MPETDPPAPPAPLSVEEWQRRKDPPAWAHRAAFVANHWCLGLLLSESEYDAALHAAQHGEIR